MRINRALKKVTSELGLKTETNRYENTVRQMLPDTAVSCLTFQRCHKSFTHAHLFDIHQDSQFQNSICILMHFIQHLRRCHSFAEYYNVYKISGGQSNDLKPTR
jgi:hypothetical protein